MQSTVSTETGARKQHDRLAGGASKEQPSPHLFTTMCVAVYEGVCVQHTISQIHTEMSAQDARGCPRLKA